MAFWDIVIAVLLFLWELLKQWLYIFISPIENLEILWIIIPIWLSWFFAEFFQEKRGTSFGNAISNGIIPLWIGIDWTRYLTRMIMVGELNFSLMLILKYFLCLLAIVYGFSIVYFGIKAKSFVHLYGRIREVTYFLIMFSPVIYGIMELTWKYLLAVVLFFPLFYFLIELIDRLTPNPEVLEYDERKENYETLNLGNDFNDLNKKIKI